MWENSLLNIIVKYVSVSRKVLKEILQLPLLNCRIQSSGSGNSAKITVSPEGTQNTTSLAALSSILKEEE